MARSRNLLLFAGTLVVAAATVMATAELSFAGESANRKGDATEAAWLKFQAAVRSPASVPPASPVEPESLKLPADGTPADVSVSGEGVYQLHFQIDGRAQTRTVRLPATLGALIQPEFKPNHAQVTITDGKLTGITLIEAARGQEEHQIRKILINLTMGDGSGAATERFPGDCKAALYPSGGSFYSLPVLVGQSCGDVVSNPDSPTYALAF